MREKQERIRGREGEGECVREKGGEEEGRVREAGSGSGGRRGMKEVKVRKRERNLNF